MGCVGHGRAGGWRLSALWSPCSGGRGRANSSHAASPALSHGLPSFSGRLQSQHHSQQARQCHDRHPARGHRRRKARRDGARPTLARQVIRENPDDANAWYLLSQLVDSDARRAAYLSKALAPNPDPRAGTGRAARCRRRACGARANRRVRGADDRSAARRGAERCAGVAGTAQPGDGPHGRGYRAARCRGCAGRTCPSPPTAHSTPASPAPPTGQRRADSTIGAPGLANAGRGRSWLICCSLPTQPQISQITQFRILIRVICGSSLPYRARQPGGSTAVGAWTRVGMPSARRRRHTSGVAAGVGQVETLIEQ